MVRSFLMWFELVVVVVLRLCVLWLSVMVIGLILLLESFVLFRSVLFLWCCVCLFLFLLMI